jgi:hypothetical protein
MVETIKFKFEQHQAQQKHAPDGENFGGAEAANSLVPLVMRVVRFFESK